MSQQVTEQEMNGIPRTKAMNDMEPYEVGYVVERGVYVMRVDNIYIILGQNDFYYGSCTLQVRELAAGESITIKYAR